METQFALETFETHEKQPFYNLDWTFWKPTHLYKTLDLDSGFGGFGSGQGFIIFCFVLFFSKLLFFFYYEKLKVCTCQWPLYCMKLYETYWQLASCAICCQMRNVLRKTWRQDEHRISQRFPPGRFVANLLLLRSFCLCFKVVQWMFQSDATEFDLSQQFLKRHQSLVQTQKTEQASLSFKIFPQLILHVSPLSSSAVKL